MSYDRKFTVDIDIFAGGMSGGPTAVAWAPLWSGVPLIDNRALVRIALEKEVWKKD